MKKNRGNKSMKFERCPRCKKLVDNKWIIYYRGHKIGCGSIPCRISAISKMKGANT